MPAASAVGSNGVKNRVAQLIAIADIASLKALYDSGEWADLELAVHGLTLCKYSALAYAAWEEQLEVMRWLLDKGAKANEVRAYHEPPANVAASCSFIAGLELLKERGCDFTKGNSDGGNPILCAAIGGHLSALRVMHSWGVPMHVMHMSGRTPADIASRFGYTECSKFLKEITPSDQLVKDHVRNLIKDGHTTALDELHDSSEWNDLEMTVDSEKAPDGSVYPDSCLAFAADHKQLEVMRWLLDKGAKSNEMRENHEPPSNIAASRGFIAGLELLKERGCDFTKGNSRGGTPVLCAAIGGHLSALRIMHSWGVPMRITIQNGRTPADIATQFGHTECLKFLKEDAAATDIQAVQRGRMVRQEIPASAFLLLLAASSLRSARVT